jgi:hypothetical protein
MIRKIISLSIIVTLFYSCLPASRINITGRYFLETDDLGRYVGYQTDQEEISLTLVDHYVFAAGYTDKYIVAIQHPKTREGVSVDSNYYIVPFHREYTYSPQDGIIGPLTLKEYTIKKDELKIDHLIWRKFN